MILNRFILLLLAISFFSSPLWAQSINDLENQKKKSEKEISYLNKLLKDVAKDKSVSIGKLSILKEKISQSKKLLNSLNDEVSILQRNIEKNEKRIHELENERDSMLVFYSKLVYETWKKRNKINQLMFIFSASNFNQAYMRFKYFQQIEDYSGKQIELIKRMNDSEQKILDGGLFQPRQLIFC